VAAATFLIFFYLLRVEFFFLFLIFSGLGKVANEQKQERTPQLRCFRELSNSCMSSVNRNSCMVVISNDFTLLAVYLKNRMQRVKTR